MGRQILQGLFPISGGSSNNGGSLTPEQEILINTIIDKADKDHTHEITDINNLEDELDNRYTKIETMSKTEIENLIKAIASGINWKLPVDTKTDLPMTDNKAGDTRIVKDEDSIYVWNEEDSQWVEIGGSCITDLATQTTDGLMSKEDKIKLDSIIINDLITKTDLSTTLTDYAQKTDLDSYLKPSNIIAGDNIILDVVDNNITIKATASGGASTGGTSDFEMLSNKPKINGITIIGEKTSKDLGLLDSSYASEKNEGSVKLADKAKEVDIEGQLDGTAKYYGVANGGTSEDNTVKLRPFPVGLATERIETLDFEILTKDVPQSIPFAREIPTVNCFVQAFKQEEAELNVTDVFEDYNNELVSNHSENINCDVSNGLSIKDKYEYKSSLNDDGIYETDLISKNDFIEILSIKCN